MNETPKHPQLFEEKVQLMQGLLFGVDDLQRTEGSIQGAVIGGFFLGLTETVGRELLNEIPGVNLPNQWKDVVAFSLLVLVLIFRPTGIFRQRETKRA
mgnify:CR=1 FL=1